MDIWECALGFMDSQVLLTAEELGVFNSLAKGPRTADEIATEVSLPQPSAERLLTMLSALEIVCKQPDGRYVNSPQAEEQLVEGRPGYIGEMFDHIRNDLYPVWGYFKEALQEEKAQWHRAFEEQDSPTEEMYSNPDALRAFMHGMHTITYEAAHEFAQAAHELETIDNILDIGGASGAFIIALANEHPHLEGTVFDLTPVQPIAEEFFQKYGLEDRLNFCEGDFFNNPFPSGYDAYSMGFILHDWTTEEGSLLLRKISEAVDPGGLLIIGEYLFNDQKTGPLHVARSDLNMLVAARGRERSAAEYSDWIGEYGFELERIQPTSKGKNFLIARKR